MAASADKTVPFWVIPAIIRANEAVSGYKLYLAQNALAVWNSGKPHMATVTPRIVMGRLGFKKFLPMVNVRLGMFQCQLQ
ncbi:hypothetical protein [Sphingobium chlorophenolicum]|uniref:hypothetical protein n=1 Tax=Sphingobium chlorophenolicum TaxID=46429 RepID=UPI0012DC1025|nr:hypothetical protein [Sphingobium chlorophenolicum]